MDSSIKAESWHLSMIKLVSPRLQLTTLGGAIETVCGKLFCQKSSFAHQFNEGTASNEHKFGGKIVWILISWLFQKSTDLDQDRIFTPSSIDTRCWLKHDIISLRIVVI